MQQYTQHCYSFYGLSALALFVTLAGPAATESDTYRLPHTLVLSQAIQPSPSQVAGLPTSPLPQEQVATRPTSAVALNIYFASDSAKISPKYYNELNKFGEALLRLSVPVEISGHTDNNGPEDYNQLLSELRAESVKWYLVNHFGINPLRVSARGYGNRRPRASNDSESGRSQNRRIEVSAEDKPVEQAAVKKVDVSALIDALHAPEGADRWAAAQALGNIKAKAKAAVPALINTLSIQTGADRRAAIEALGDIGAEAKAAFPALIDALQDRVWTVYAAKALSQIAPSFQDRAESLTMADLRYVIADLEKALKVLEDVRMEFAGKEDVIRSLQRPRDALDAQLKLRVPQQLLQHKMTPSVVAFFLLLLWLALLWLQPLWLIHLDEWLITSALKAKLPYIDLPIRYLLGLALFAHHPRALNAWVNHYLPRAREEFEQTDTVKRRRIHVQMPVTLDGVTVMPTASDFIRFFAQGRAVLLIKGEGGIGKTSFACQLAHWAMADRQDERLCRHPMLSVLFEYTLPKQPDGKTLSLTEAVRGKLITLTGADVAPSLELVTVLLQKRRILVIIDGLSESDEGTKQAIDPASPSFVTNALIVTSRTEERLGGSAKRVAQPQRLKGQRVSFFIEAYLVRQGKQELYTNDEELFETCRQLTRLVTDREVTVMLAKLFVDQTIAAKEGNEDIAMPHTLPELILGYVNLVNRPSAFALGRLPNDVVRKAAKCVAWACIERTFRPDAVETETVLQSLGGSEEARAQLDALERSDIIQVLPPLDRVRFVLDPLAEYLAGLHLVEWYSEREASERKEAWRAFLEQTDRVPGAPEAITGFLLAVRDCCLARGTEAGIPAYIPSALAARARLAPTIDEQ